jgi:hypothetical protein
MDDFCYISHIEVFSTQVVIGENRHTETGVWGQKALALEVPNGQGSACAN